MLLTGKKRTKGSESHHPARAQEHSGEDTENPGKRKGKRPVAKGKPRERKCGECGVPIRVMGHISSICPAVWVQLNRPLETGRIP